VHLLNYCITHPDAKICYHGHQWNNFAHPQWCILSLQIGSMQPSRRPWLF
jgi:hypothetical protein